MAREKTRPTQKASTRSTVPSFSRSRRRPSPAQERLQGLPAEQSRDHGQSKWGWIGLTLLFIAAFALYLASTPRTVMLEDDGLFIAAAHVAGVPHPPGYPLYVILGWMAAHVPFGTIAWRVHALSGAMGALTCVCIAWLVWRRTGNRPAAYLAGAALAVSEHFWSQAIIADVYTTNAAVLFLTLALAQKAAWQGERATWPWTAAAVVYGLGLANHWPLLILGSPILLAPMIAAGRDVRIRLWYLIPITLLTAATLYGWMVWRSHQSPPINFLGPIESWGALASFIGRDIYGKADVSINAGLMDKLLYVRYFLTQVLVQFSPLGCAVAVVGLAVTWRSGWRLGLTCEAATMGAGSLLLIAWLGFDYEYFRTAIFRPYLLVPYSVLALWLGYGVHALAWQPSAWMPASWRARDEMAAPIIYGLIGVSLAALCVWNLGTNYRPRDRFAEEQAKAVLDLIEPGSVFVGYGDAYVFPITYLHVVEGERADLRLLETRGLLFDDHVVHLSWSQRRKDAAWNTFFADLKRPGYFQNLGLTLAGFGQQDLGFLKRIDPDVAPGKMGVATSERAKEYAKRLLTMPEGEDHWIERHRNGMIESYGKYLGFAIAINHPPVNEHVADVLPLAENNYWALVGMASTLLIQRGARHVATAETYLQRAKQLADKKRSKWARAHAWYLEGIIEEKKGNRDKAKALFVKSIEADRSPGNLSRKALRRLTLPEPSP